MTTLVRRYLQAGHTLAQLYEEHGVVASEGKTFPNLVTLNYFITDKTALARECRGLILDRADGWRDVARTFDRFYNVGEERCDLVLDAPGLVFEEKLDGSLCLLYFYRDAWHVATRGVADASGSVGTTEGTFAALFWQAFHAAGLKLTALNHVETYAFELTSPWNRVVVLYERPRLTWIGRRYPACGCEFPPDDTLPRPLLYKQRADVEALFAARSAVEIEGVVCVDYSRRTPSGSYLRAKWKHPQYQDFHHAMTGNSVRSLFELARAGAELDPALAKTVLAETLADYTARLQRVTASMEAAYAEATRDAATLATAQGIAPRKAFGIVASRSPFSGALFAVRDGKAESFAGYLAACHIDNALRLCGVKDDTALVSA